jgi:hypothetical protein
MLVPLIMFAVAILIGVRLGRRAKRTPANHLTQFREVIYVRSNLVSNH